MPQNTTSSRPLKSENITFDHNFPYAGIVDNGSLNGVGSIGHYWSRTAKFTTLAYGLGFASSDVISEHGGLSRFLGFSIRCVATT